MWEILCFRPDGEGRGAVWCNPVERDAYMALLV